MNKIKSDIEKFQLIQSSMYDIAKATHTIKDTFSLYQKIHVCFQSTQKISAAWYS